MRTVDVHVKEVQRLAYSLLSEIKTQTWFAASRKQPAIVKSGQPIRRDRQVDRMQVKLNVRIREKDLRRLGAQMRAICSILKSHVRGDNFDPQHIRLVGKALSEPVVKLEAERDSPSAPVCLVPSMKTKSARRAAETLVAYLRWFAEDPRVRSCDPIGACPGCGDLFVKKKFSQVCCSPKCYAKYWAANKLREDPAYYRRSAAMSREHKKRRASRIKKVSARSSKKTGD